MITYYGYVKQGTYLMLGRIFSYLPCFWIYGASLLEVPGAWQVWSLTQFYSVDFSKSMISVKKCVFYQRTIKVRISFCWRCPGTSVASAAHLTVSLYICSSGSIAQCESMVWDRETRELLVGTTEISVSLIRGSLICPSGKSMSFHKKETEKSWISGQTWSMMGYWLQMALNSSDPLSTRSNLDSLMQIPLPTSGGEENQIFKLLSTGFRLKCIFGQI